MVMKNSEKYSLGFPHFEIEYQVCLLIGFFVKVKIMEIVKIKGENCSKALHVFNILKVNFSCKYKKRLDKRCIKRRVNKFEPQWYIFFYGCMHGLQNMICPPLYLHNLMGKWILCNLFQFHYMRDKETLLFSSSNPSDANWNVYYALNYFFFFDRQIKLKLQKWYNN